MITWVKERAWLQKGLGVLLVGSGSVFLSAGFPSQLVLLVIGVPLTITGILFVLARQ